MNGPAVVYVATGSSFLDEAFLNASLSCSYLHASFCLVTDQLSFRNSPHDLYSVFDQIFFISSPSYSYRDKILGIELALSFFSSLLFLDTDAVIVSHLDSFLTDHLSADFTACFSPVRIPDGWTSPLAPSYFPEYNSGVMLFRNCPAVFNLLRDWLLLYDQLSIEFNQYWDQASLRHVLWTYSSSHLIKITTLPSEFNLRLTKPWIVGKGFPVYILHGRFDRKELKDFLAYLNRDISRFRAWSEWLHLFPNSTIKLKIPNDPFF